MKNKYALLLVLTCFVLSLFAMAGHATDKTENTDDNNCAPTHAEEVPDQNQPVPTYTPPKPLEG